MWEKIVEHGKYWKENCLKFQASVVLFFFFFQHYVSIEGFKDNKKASIARVNHNAPFDP